MIITNMKRVSQKGFTVVEVSIAAAVFSLVLLVALASFFQIGRLFYKGVTVTQTQTTLSQIMQDISGNFQTASSVSPLVNSASGYHYYCIGNNRYTFIKGNEVSLDAAPNHSASGNFGLLKDILPGSGACAEPCNDNGVGCQPGMVKLNNPVEMLGEKMRLMKFDISPAPGNGNLYSVAMTIAYGDDDVLAYQTAGDLSSVYCVKESHAQEFCSVNSADTAIYRGRY